jgi:hypothetical protein
MNEMIYFQLIFIVVCLFLTTRIAARMDKNLAKKYAKEVVPVEKRCPAHKWQYNEQPGVQDAYYMRCEWCGMIPGQEGRV